MHDELTAAVHYYGDEPPRSIYIGEKPGILRPWTAGYGIFIMRYTVKGPGTGQNKTGQAGPWRVPLLPMQAFLVVSLFAVGLFYEAASCMASIFLLGYALYCRKKAGRLLVPASAAALAATCTVLLYGFTAFWGVDRGMAWIGFAKFLPLPLFCLAAAQLDPAQRRALPGLLPWVGAAMVPASWLLGRIPALREYFIIGGRLAGFFQYANVFGLLLLLGAAVLLERERWDRRSTACLAALLLGVFLTGSRTTFALLAVTAVIYALRGGKRTRLLLGVLLGTLLAATAVFAAVTGDLRSVGRYLTASLSSSTFLGRLLYFRDALPVIARHPFGLGYMGYYFTQGSFQTGVYTVLNVHNELLQLLLDVGWVPAALFVWASFRALLPGRNDALGRVLTVLICAHSMLDFDMQFIAMGFVLLLAMDGEGRTFPLRLHWPAALLAAAAACVSLYFGVASGLYHAHAYAAAAAVYPGYTSAYLQLLPQAEDAEAMDTLADQILRRNGSVSLAWSAKARAAYAEGDFGAVIAAKERAISLARYSLPEYLDYFDMLEMGLRLYSQAGDSASADLCLERLESIPGMLEQVLDQTSPLAWRIDDRPSLALPEAYRQRLDVLTAAYTE